MKTKMVRKSTNQAIIVNHEIHRDEKIKTNYILVDSLRGCVCSKREYLYGNRKPEDYIEWLKSQDFEIVRVYND